jgi:hypothetical protein
MRLPAAVLALICLELALAGSTDRVPQFQQVSIHADKGPRFVAVADVNHDGKPDLIVANADAGTISCCSVTEKAIFNRPGVRRFPLVIYRTTLQSRI